MKKALSIIPVFFLVLSTAYAQGATEEEGAMLTQSTPSTPSAQTTTTSTIQEVDEIVRTTARNIHTKLVALNTQKVALGQFTYQSSNTPLSTYWINQLTEELANISGRPYILLSGGTAGADWTLVGEIVALPGIIRIYTRLVRVEGRAIEASFHADLERTPALATMLTTSGGGGGGGGGGSSQGSADEWEADSWDSPVPFEIGESESVQSLSRTITSGDEDFFLLIPDREGTLVAETTGSIDTYMYLYDLETEEELARNDDGGSGSNARIRHSVQAGRRYIAKVRGYSSSTSGSYSFRAYITVRTGGTSWQTPLAYEIGVGDEAQVVNRSLDDGDDEDFFLLVSDRAGQLVMETTGSVDTYMELYEADSREMLDENDDGGSSYNARIRHNVRAGGRYMVKVRGYGSSSTGNYGFKAYFSGQGLLPADEFEPDDDPAQATLIQVGTPHQHTFHDADDVDWVKFQITTPGRYTIHTRGVRSNNLDTYIELFDANMRSIAENDDGGENLDSRLSQRLENGLYHLKVECLDDEPDQAYTISITSG